MKKNSKQIVEAFLKQRQLTLVCSELPQWVVGILVSFADFYAQQQNATPQSSSENELEKVEENLQDIYCTCTERKLLWKESSGWYCSKCYKKPS